MNGFPFEDSAPWESPVPGSADSGTATHPAGPAAPDADTDPRHGVRGTSSSSPSPSRPGVDDGEAREGGPGSLLRPDARTSPAEDPAGGARGESAAPPAGSSGQEWRDRVKAATSALHAAQRAKRGRYTRKSAGQRFGPGMGRRMPPGGGDAA